jgi:hypothetical protein
MALVPDTVADVKATALFSQNNYFIPLSAFGLILPLRRKWGPIIRDIDTDN